MLSTSKPWKSLPVVALSLFLLPPVTQAQHYKQTNLVSNLASISTPNPTDPNLKNPWGLTRSPGGSPWWVANNNSGTSTLYNGTGGAVLINGTGNVTVPPEWFAGGNPVDSHRRRFQWQPHGFSGCSRQIRSLHLCHGRWNDLRLE